MSSGDSLLLRRQGQPVVGIEQDFTEDSINGGKDFGGSSSSSRAGDQDIHLHNNLTTLNDEMNGGAGDGMSGGGDQQMQKSPGGMGLGAGEPMDSSAPFDTGSADHSGRDDDRKLFIGGLSWETTEKDLREYFTKYGAIDSLTLKTDPATGRSRGFAFIVFNDGQTLDKVVAAGDHLINGKKIDPKKAKARHGKVFIGGLSPEISDDEVRNYFQQFGKVVELEMPIDKLKNQRKGFCFVTFENEQVVHELLKTPKQTICGKEVDVKRAQPSQNQRGAAWGGIGGGMARGGRGGGMTRGGRGRGGRGGADWSGGWAYGTGYPSYGTGGYGGGFDYYGGYSGGYSSYADGYANAYGTGGSFDSYDTSYYDSTGSSTGGSMSRGSSSSRGRGSH